MNGVPAVKSFLSNAEGGRAQFGEVIEPTWYYFLKLAFGMGFNSRGQPKNSTLPIMPAQPIVRTAWAI